MTGPALHLALVGAGLVWLAFVLLIHRKTTMGYTHLIVFYGIGFVLLAAGVGLVPIPTALVAP